MKLSKLIQLDKVVEEILRKDNLAREDDNYLILKVIEKVYPSETGKTFADVMFNAKRKGISFESITRARRKVQNMHSGLCDKETAIEREMEQQNYIDYALNKHVPRLD